MKRFMLFNLILLTACSEPKVVHHTVPLRKQEPPDVASSMQHKSENPWEGDWQPVDLDRAVKLLEESLDDESEVVDHTVPSQKQPGLTFDDIPSVESIDEFETPVYGLLYPGDYYPGRISFPSLSARMQKDLEKNNAFWIEFTQPDQKWWDAEEFLNRDVFEEIPVYFQVVKYLGSDQFRIKRVGARWKIMKYEVECQGKYYEVNYDLEKFEVIKIIPLERPPTGVNN